MVARRQEGRRLSWVGATVRLVWLMGALWWDFVGAISSRVALPTLDNVWIILAYDIGLAPTANVSVVLDNWLPANNTYLMMLTHAQWSEWHHVDPTTLPGSAGSAMGGLNSYLASFWRKDIFDHAQANFQINAPQNDRYHLGVLNVQQQPLKLNGRIGLVNPGGQQLSLQEEHVPIALIWMAGLFAFTCLALALLLATSWFNGCTAMHLLMFSVILFKSVVLLLQWIDRMEVSRTGKSSVIGDVGWQLLDKVQTILELMMFLLVALGWKFLRNALNVTEIRFAVGISVISFYLGVFEVACTTASTCSGYRLSRYILHSLCYLVVIVAMNFNLQTVHAQMIDAPATVETGKLYQKHNAYRIFRWIFLVFIIAPTVEMFLKVSMMPWDAEWVYVVLQQVRTWAIYMCVVAAFRPEPAPLRVFELTARDAGSSDDEAIDEGVAELLE